MEAAADAYLRQGAANQNQGTETILRVQASGDNRVLVGFDQSAIVAAVGSEGLASAILRLNVDFNADNWGPDGRPVNVHRMTEAWTELGATWNCPDDTDTSNGSPDCNPQWEMGSGPWPFELAPTDVVSHANGQSGWVEWDVTADVQAFLDGAVNNNGWVVRKNDEGATGHVDYSSREGSFAPQLVLTLGQPPPLPPLMLTSIADTFLTQGQQNQAHGNELFLRLQASGNNRALVLFDQAAIETAVGTGTLVSAKLKLTITSNSNNWGQTGREVNVHRLLVPWTEQGATWNCPDDTNPANSSPNCDPDWIMSNSSQWPFVAERTGFYVQQNDQTGAVEIDVTADVAAFLGGTAENHGWIVKKDSEGASGKVEYSSREGEFTPELVLEVQGGSPTDTTPPAISAIIDPPPNAAGWNRGPVTVTFDCQDADTGISFCTAPVTVSSSATTEITGLAQDGAFNTAQLTVTVNIDPVAPLLVPILSPEPNAAGWNKEDVTVGFQAGDPISGVASVTSPIVLTTEGAAQQTVGTATDVAGNVTEIVATASIDKTPPELALDTPTPGSVLLQPFVDISGTVSDALSGLAGVTCGGQPAQIPVGELTCRVTLTAGPNAIAVEATDFAGNVSAQNVEVTFAAPPALSIVTPADFATFAGGPIVVAGSVDDDVVEVLVNGVAAQLGSGTFTASYPLHSGVNTIAAVARNAAGNSALATVHVVLDDGPPQLTIGSPLDGAVVSTPAIAVIGQVSDPLGPLDGSGSLSVSVNEVTAAIDSGRYIAEGVVLSPGPNVLTAQASDAAGNAATTTITVTFQDLTGQPRIEPVSGDLQSVTIGAALGEPLVVRVVDAGGSPVTGAATMFRITRGNGSLAASADTGRILTVTTDAQGQAQVTWTVGTQAGNGANLLEATATGFGGRVLFSAAGQPGAERLVHYEAGDNQAGMVGQPLPFPLVVTVTDTGSNRLPGVPVTFGVQAGGGNFNGQPATIVNTDMDGNARAVLTLGPEEGIANNIVVVDVASNLSSPATFSATALIPGDPAATRITGIVLDNTNIPIAGVTVSVHGTPVAAQTDIQGRFVLQPAPVGALHLFADGSTAQRPGTWPLLAFHLVTIPGRDNTLGMPIFLLPIDTNNSLHVSPTEGGVLPLPGMPGFELEVAPGSATFPDGSSEGDLSVTLVHADKVPMVPNFGQQPRLAGTLQPPGTILDPPAKVTFPNLDGNAPGEAVDFYSFDHDVGRFVSIGTGTVTEDGLVVRSDPGVGIPKSGWFANGPPQPRANVQNVNVSITSHPVFVLLNDGESDDVIAAGGPTEADYFWTVSGSGLEIQGPSSGQDLKQVSVVRVAPPPGAPLSMSRARVAQAQPPCTETILSVTIVKDGNVATDSTKLATLCLDSPEMDETFFIEDEDSTKMPELELRSRVLGVDPATLAGARFDWEFVSELEVGECQVAGSGPIAKQERTQMITFFAPNADKRLLLLQGGRTKVTLTATIQGKKLAAETDVYLGGRNPDAAVIAARLPHRTLRHIACHESTHEGEGMLQFAPSQGTNPFEGCPLLNGRGDGGVGVMQITNPPPRYSDHWDWRANVDSGIALFAEKEASSVTYPQRLVAQEVSVRTIIERTQAALNAQRVSEGKAEVDVVMAPFTTSGFDVADLNTLAELERETIRAYNGLVGKTRASGTNPSYTTLWHEFEPVVILGGGPLGEDIYDTAITMEGQVDPNTGGTLVRGRAEIPWQVIPVSERPAAGNPNYVNVVINQEFPCR